LSNHVQSIGTQFVVQSTDPSTWYAEPHVWEGQSNMASQTMLQTPSGTRTQPNGEEGGSGSGGGFATNHAWQSVCGTQPSLAVGVRVGVNVGVDVMVGVSVGVEVRVGVGVDMSDVSHRACCFLTFTSRTYPRTAP
jgi:hypothetical protein